MTARLGIVTATVSLPRAEPCLHSWLEHSSLATPVTIVETDPGGPLVGPVRAFRAGVDQHLNEHPTSEVIACFHDDLVIFERDWDERILASFDAAPTVGLISFGGYAALGPRLEGQGYRTSDVATTPIDAPEAGMVVAPAPFALIGRRAFWSGFSESEWRTRLIKRKGVNRPWALLDDAGFINHFYAQALGCCARRLRWQVYYCPVRCRHLGGQTTGDPGYQRWAAGESQGGDRGFYQTAQRIGCDAFGDLLPLQLPA